MTPVHYEPAPARQPTVGLWWEVRGKRFLAWLLRLILRPHPWSEAELARLPVRQLLVIRQHNQMGDMVLCLPTLDALRARWPQARLRFVTAPICEELLQGYAGIDELLVFRKREMQRPVALWRWLRQLRRPRPDVAIVLGSVSFSTTSALLALCSGARVRVGASSQPFGSGLSRAIYHRELAAPEGQHECDRNLSTLRSLGIQAAHALPRLRPTSQALAHASAFLQQASSGDATPRRWIVLHTGAGKRANIWPAEAFAALANRLDDGDTGFVLTEGPRDAAIVEAVIADLRVLALRWRRSLGDTLGLLGQAALVISNDTGMAHVAAAVGVPTLVLFGPTDPDRWRPAGTHVQVLRSPTARIIDLSEGTVWRAATDLLQGEPSPPIRNAT